MGRYSDEEQCRQDKICLEEEEDEQDSLCCNNESGAPDGGWAWVVMLASLINVMVVDGISFSFSSVMQDLSQEFPDVSVVQLAWIGSSLPGTYLLVGPFVSVLCQHYGCRRVTMLGALIATCGFAVATQAKTIEFFIFSYCIVGGVGFGMIYLPSIVSVGYWFDKRRALATGAVLCGSGAGLFLIPPLVRMLQCQYTMQGLILVLAGIVLNCAVCGSVFFSLPTQRRPRKAIETHVEIARGCIMKALIEDKKRQRTISNGSLDNCVITRDNKLIKLDPRIFQLRRNDSFLARFRRQLGWSSQSLASSKTSVSRVPSIVIQSVQQEHNKALAGSPVFRGSTNLRVTQLSQTSLPQRGSFPDSALLPKDGATSLNQNTVPKTQSCSGLAEEGQRCTMALGGSESQICGSEGSGSGESGVADMAGSLQVSIQAIEELPAPGSVSRNNSLPRSLRSLRQHSSPSECSVGTIGGYSLASSAHSSCCGSLASLDVDQLQNQSLEALERQYAKQHSLLTRWGAVVTDMFAFRLLANPVFLLLVLSSMVTLLGFMSPYMFMPDAGIRLGMTQAELLVPTIGITNTLGRILSGWLADRPWVSTFFLNNSALAVAGLSIAMVPMCTSVDMLAVIAAVFGFSIAVFHSLRSILLVELLGLDTLTKAFGVLSLFQGLAMFVGLPLTGVVDTQFSLNWAFYMSGGLMVLSALIMLPIRCLRSHRQVDPRLVAPYAATPLPPAKLPDY